MNDERKSIWQREILPETFIFRWARQFFRWLFSWRGIRRLLIVLAWTASIIALLYGEENWRGRHAWNKYRQELEAQGKQLDLQAFIPKPVPDDQNFAATPFIKSWFVRSNGGFGGAYWRDDYDRVSVSISTPPSAKNDGNRHLTDLVAWGMGFDAIRSGELYSYSSRNRRWRTSRKFESGKLDLESRAQAAPSILEGLKSNEVVFAELRAASQRPYSRYPLVYDLDNPWAILLPHLGNARSVVRQLQLKACAELAAGQSQNALEDVNLMLYLADSVKGEPFLVSYLVRIACVQHALQPVWEGLAEHRWSEAQLHELQARLQQYNFVADLEHPLDTERAGAILMAELVRKKGLGYLDALEDGGSRSSHDRAVANLLGLLVPSGWLYQEQLNYCRRFELGFGGTFDGARKQVSPSRIGSSQEALNANFRGSAGGTGISRILRHEVLAGMLLPAIGRMTFKAGAAQTIADHAAIACALERYRLANGQFPEKLESLVPRFISPLPHDVINGSPYKYRRTDNGSFVLWSVGWDEKDDGGLPGKMLFDETQGDWVWQYPEK